MHRRGAALRAFLLPVLLVPILLLGACSPGQGGAGIERIDRHLGSLPPDSPQTVAAARDIDYRPLPETSHLAEAMAGSGWWRITPAPAPPADAGAGRQRLLLLYYPYSAEVTVLMRSAGEPVTASIFESGLDPAWSRRALVFPLDSDGPIHVGVRGARYPLPVEIADAHEYAARDRNHMRLLWGSGGILVGVSLAVLLFWCLLRERVYLLFSASMALQLLYVLCAYGEAYSVPGLAWLARFGVEGIWFIATCSTMVAVLFLLDFAELRPRAPALSFTLFWVGVALPSVLLVGLLLPWPADKSWFPPMGNSLLLLANAVAIVTLLRVWLGGGRHAGLVLIAWVPMVVASTARTVQLAAGVPLTPWLEYGLPLLLAFASVVLVLGLADRMLTFRRERDAAKQHAEHDGLTGAFNRDGIIKRLRRAVAEVARSHQPVSVLFLDLDHFKAINDNYGHAVGDACLRTVVAMIRDQARLGDQLGRVGGEEFLLYLPGATLAAARGTAERLRLEVESRCRQVMGAPVALTLSIGVVEYRPGETVDALIQRADEAMYEAKRTGRNRVVVLAAA
ncbi:sensor domain-containing diguanylate cyclase [Marilutibacter alkalisoli]|uniref:diguanylate cyclase n=1 Tax=Marilutibacter alkalisoli TaxID=2591633 RepID=A0A514BNI9_9GAMM|nr:diguanylate cyclase [Lysobacter alkalisoli]QDH68930.1 diguanylate cyclase [Lysobacter alkalisoli]